VNKGRRGSGGKADPDVKVQLHQACFVLLKEYLGKGRYADAFKLLFGKPLATLAAALRQQ
jgi:hypothetical protein